MSEFVLFTSRLKRRGPRVVNTVYRKSLGKCMGNIAPVSSHKNTKTSSLTYVDTLRFALSRPRTNTKMLLASRATSAAVCNERTKARHNPGQNAFVILPRLCILYSPILPTSHPICVMTYVPKDANLHTSYFDPR